MKKWAAPGTQAVPGECEIRLHHRPAAFFPPPSLAMATERTPLVAKAPEEASRLDFALLMTGIWSAVFISSLDATVVATLISTIGSSLKSMQLSSWIGTSYLLSLCAFTPIYGRLANIVGRRPSILFSIVVFGGGTALCGFATTMSQLIAFRALAGIGGAGITVIGSVIVSDSVPLKSRGLYQGFTNLLFGLGGAIGAPLGGWLGDTIGWRAAFLCQSPFLVLAAVLLHLKTREPAVVLAARGGSISAKLKRVDYAGSVSLILALLSALVGLNYKSTGAYGWDDAHVWGLLSAGFVSACVFVSIESKFAIEPVMPIIMLKRRTPGFVALNNFVLAVLTFSTTYNTPLYFTAARLRTATNAGAHLIPNSVAVSIGSLFAGWYMRKTGRYWRLQALACLGVVAANLALSSWNMETPEWVLYATLIPSGFGFAATLTTTLLALIASVPQDEIPLATGLSYLFRTTGQVLGVSLSAALTQTLLARNLRARITGPDADETIAKILASTTYIRTLPPPLQEQATASWLGALHTVFCCQIGLAAAMFLSALPIEERELPDTVGGGEPVKRTLPDVEGAAGPARRDS
ncbi:MFS general substrate transporter [Mycena belliarum]|uniref:MFS general substrate transporter n=1 Tax=Mycena belliarum TaxID=1033014 RepID=A0AAD6TQX7_9AGAR|nr:MFS general substrate transporter [Mycena belliae]